MKINVTWRTKINCPKKIHVNKNWVQFLQQCVHSSLDTRWININLTLSLFPFFPVSIFLSYPFLNSTIIDHHSFLYHRYFLYLNIILAWKYISFNNEQLFPVGIISWYTMDNPINMMSLKPVYLQNWESVSVVKYEGTFLAWI